MAKQITITRKQVIKALRTERLRKGQWMRAENGDEIENCQVCAVGAVLRDRVVPQNVSVANEAIGRLTRRGGPLLTLSDRFEDEAAEWTRFTKPRREKLVRWAKKNLPASFRVRIPASLQASFR